MSVKSIVLLLNTLLLSMNVKYIACALSFFGLLYIISDIILNLSVPIRFCPVFDVFEYFAEDLIHLCHLLFSYRCKNLSILYPLLKHFMIFLRVN